MRKHFLLVTALAVAMALSTVAPALAKGGPPEGKGKQAETAQAGETGKSVERGNWLSGVAEPVELTADDITFHTPGDIDYVRVEHGIGAYDTLVQREPARYKQNVVDRDGGDFTVAWLGIAGPEGPELDHKGELHWYYEVGDGEWVSLTFEFDGQGDLVRVNDAHVE